MGCVFRKMAQCARGEEIARRMKSDSSVIVEKLQGKDVLPYSAD